MVFQSGMPFPVLALWQFHEDVKALNLLSPPGTKVRIVGPETAVRNGALHQLEIRAFGIRLRWDARIHDVAAPYGFWDTAERSPYANWTHHHEFIEDGSNSILRDTVTFELPLWCRILTPLARLQVALMFRHRHRVTRAEAFRSPTSQR